MTSIESSAFKGCTSLTSVTFPNSVSEIGSEAFCGCSGLTSITIPNSVINIDWNAFKDCSGLKSVYISDLSAWCEIEFHTPNSNPLYYAHRLNLNGVDIKVLVIPNDVTSIGSYTFDGCSNITSIIIPNTVNRIDDSAFANCSGLTSVYCYAKNVPEINHYAFDEVNTNEVTLYVPAESVDAYKDADVWRDFGSIKPILFANDIASLDNAIYVNEVEALAGESVVLSVNMKNGVDVSGLQCNVYLPEGMEVEKVARGQRLKMRDEDDEYIFSFDNSKYEDGSRFLLAYTSRNEVIEDNDGEIATITVKIPETMNPGDYPILIKNIELSKDGNSTEIDGLSSILRILEYRQGDANGDGKLSVSDLTSIASHLLGKAPANFNINAADANGDGKISVSDITAIAKMLLNGSNNARVRTLFTEKVE